jgi:ribose/xylose/arabinose/galactoside ABC-type transport system permease subunit
MAEEKSTILEEPVRKKRRFDIQSLFLKYSVYIVLIVLFLYFSFSSPMFLSQGNVGNFFRQIPPVGILTIGYTMILITGYVDLSIASIAAFSGTTAAYLAALDVNPVLVILISLLIGGTFGAINGFLIKKLDLPSFILTLGTNYIIHGIIMFVTNGIFVTGAPPWFRKIATTQDLRECAFQQYIDLYCLESSFFLLL